MTFRCGTFVTLVGRNCLLCFGMITLFLTGDSPLSHTRYGVCGGAGGCAYGDPHNNGFQEILTASLAGALELGAFECVVSPSMLCLLCSHTQWTDVLLFKLRFVCPSRRRESIFTYTIFFVIEVLDCLRSISHIDMVQYSLG